MSLEDKADSRSKSSAGNGDNASSDELKSLRFNYHRTAFDIDIDEEESRPWRLPFTDLTDFFNYGFDEATWKVCFHSFRISITFNVFSLSI
jgi:hypothetical protein